jgi:hypothetical protein
MVLKASPNFGNIIDQFQVSGTVQDAFPYGDGHINDTYLVSVRGSGCRCARYVLQRINHTVFKNPETVMANMVRITEHIRQRVQYLGGDPARKTITLIPTVDGESFYRDPSGNCWRLAYFIDGARTYLQAENPGQYYHAAFAFGEFLALLSDFPVDQLHETIPDFHHTPRRYQTFLRAVEADRVNRVRTVKSEIDFIIAREPEAGTLVDLLAAGELPLRVTHNDTKVDNVMIDDETGEGLCVIDLDTVMPGLSVFDFGDAVRSGANLAAEDETDPSRVAFSLQIFDTLAHGFLDAARGVLTKAEQAHLAFGTKLITLEQGVRFLTDYLNGDIYYKTYHPNQNLNRTRTQLKLVEDMENQLDQMEAIIRSCG